MISFDFETALIESGLQFPPPVCMAVAGADLVPDRKEVETPAGVGYVMLADAGCDVLEHCLVSGLPLVGHNAPFDLGVACAHRPALLPYVFRAYDAGLIYDTMTRQKLIDIALGEGWHQYNLASLTKRLLDIEMAKEGTWRLRYWELKGIPLKRWPKEALDYSAFDATATLLIYETQERELAEADRLCVLDDQHRQCRADFILGLASAWGLRTDPQACKKLRDGCEKTLGDTQEQLLSEGLLREKTTGRGANKTVVGVSKNMRAIQQAVFDAAGNEWEAVALTDTGIKNKKAGKPWQELKYIKTDEESCSDFSTPLLKTYTAYSKAASLLSGYVPAVEGGTLAPIHTYFEVLRNTGRTSSSNPNIQNVRTAKGARECFIPREGCCFIGCDIDRAELHTLAQVCLNVFGYSTLADTLNSGIDPHTRFGARLAGLKYEDLVKALKDDDEKAKEARGRAKPANFGFPGGMGATGMRKYAKQYKIELSQEDAQALYDSWCEEYPEISGDYLGWIRTLTETGSGTIMHFGSNRWRGGCSYCAAANSFFQGMAADGLKAMLWEVGKKCYLPGTALYGCRIVNEVHDEIIVEAPVDQASDAAFELETTMINAYNTYTKDVPVKASACLMDCWSKSAKRIVEDGVMQIWRYRE